MRCEVCFRHCDIKDGETGFCGGRAAEEGRVFAANYGKITALALDPIEKKPLNRFYPGSFILSAGSYGCNLRCPFCQNSEISWGPEAGRFRERARVMLPEDLRDLALKYRRQGNIGLAFTYNEPLIGYEFVRDTAALVHEAGMKNVLVTNGTAELSVLRALSPYVDAMNIDLKGFRDDWYGKVLGGSRSMVLDFIREAVKTCHVELTTLIIPGENDSEEEMRELSGWIADIPDAVVNGGGKRIPLHITRFFPRFHMTDRPATPVKKIYRLAEIAAERLTFVYTGNC